MEHIRLSLATDTPPDKFVLLAKYCLTRAGVPFDAAPEALHKATGTVRRRRGRPPTGTLDAEASHSLATPGLEAHWRQLEAWGRTWPTILQEALNRLMIDTPVTNELVKARVFGWLIPFTGQQWATLRFTLDGVASIALDWLTGRKPGPESRPRVDPRAFPPALRDSYGNAARAGMEHGVQETPPAPRPRALTPAERAAIRIAQQHAGARLRPIFRGLNDRLEARILEQERQAVRTLIPQALETRTGPMALASALADEAGNFDRDWHRVARTELSEAFNQGAAEALIARHPSNQERIARGEAPQIPNVKVFKITSVNACLSCQRIWLQPDGTPRLYDLQEVVSNPSNDGRPAAEWTAQIGPIHPNCTEGSLLEYSPVVEPTFERMRQEAAIRP
jgi:hypothetical protein